MKPEPPYHERCTICGYPPGEDHNIGLIVEAHEYVSPDAQPEPTPCPHCERTDLTDEEWQQHFYVGCPKPDAQPELYTDCGGGTCGGELGSQCDACLGIDAQPEPPYHERCTICGYPPGEDHNIGLIVEAHEYVSPDAQPEPCALKDDCLGPDCSHVLQDAQPEPVCPREPKCAQHGLEVPPTCTCHDAQPEPKDEQYTPTRSQTKIRELKDELTALRAERDAAITRGEQLTECIVGVGRQLNEQRDLTETAEAERDELATKLAQMTKALQAMVSTTSPAPGGADDVARGNAVRVLYREASDA